MYAKQDELADQLSIYNILSKVYYYLLSFDLADMLEERDINNIFLWLGGNKRRKWFGFLKKETLSKPKK